VKSKAGYEQAAHRDAVGGVEGQGTDEEARRRRARPVGQLLGAGRPGGVIDGHVHDTPADAAAAVLDACPAEEAPARYGGKAAGDRAS